MAARPIRQICLYAFALVSAQWSLAAIPDELKGLEGAVPRVYGTSVSKIPNSVVAALETVRGLSEFKMADVGGRWHWDDTVSDESLPFRRLIWFVSVKGFVLVHYEQGGYAHDFHIIVISPENDNGTRRVVLAAGCPNQIRDYTEFISLLDSGKLFTDPRIYH